MHCTNGTKFLVTHPAATTTVCHQNSFWVKSGLGYETYSEVLLFSVHFHI